MKKTLVALLAVAMVLSLVGPVFAAPADVEGTKYEDAAVRLIALGIFKGDDKGNFNPEAAITRAEAVAIIIRALGLEQSSELMNGVTKFADVNADAGLQWATGAINVAVSSGIVNGYPDGNFGGRDHVTYEQLAKMVLYALNYGVVVEGGVWPTAVLAKADDLEILKGIAVVPGVAIIRGLAAQMLDNSLDVNSLRQYGYGDIQTYNPDGETLLEKMGLDEIEGRVVGIPEVEKGLKKDEVSIAVTKVNGDKVEKTETYAEIEGVDVQGLFGLKVKAWAKDDEIMFVENKTASNDVFVDTLDGAVNKDNQVDLVVLDDDVEFASKPEIYINYKSAKLSDLKAGMYGRLVQDKGEIVFANLFNFESNEGVITKVENDRVRYFVYDDTERTLNLSKADSITVFNADLTTSDYDELDKDDVISWWKSSDDYYIVVASEKVKGELTKVKDDKVTIDGKAYTIKEDKASFSLADDEEIDKWVGNADDLDDLYDEEVVALLNLKGHVRHLRGDVESTSGTQYGIITASPSDSKITVFNKDGKEATYDLDKRSDWGVLRTPKVTDTKYYGTEDTLGYYVLRYKVKADGSIAGTEGNVGVRQAISVNKTKKANIEELGTKKDVAWGNVDKAEKGDRFVKVGDEKFYIDSKTVVMRAVNSKGELDPEVLAWEDFKDLIIYGANEENLAVVFGEANKDAKAIIFVDAEFAGTTEDTYYGVVTDKPWKADGDWYAEIDVFEKGIVEYKLSSTTRPAKGDLVEFTLNAKGEADVVKSPTAKEVKKVDGNYIDLGSGDWYKVESDAVVYDWNNDDNKLGDKLVRSDIDEKDTIQFVADGKVIKAVIINKGTAPSGGDLVEGVVTYIVTDYTPAFGRLALEDVDTNKSTKTIDSFDAVFFNDVEVSKTVMKAWFADKFENEAEVVVEITEDKVLVVKEDPDAVEEGGSALVFSNTQFAYALDDPNIDSIEVYGEIDGFTVDRELAITGDAVVNGKIMLYNGSDDTTISGLTFNVSEGYGIEVSVATSGIVITGNTFVAEEEIVCAVYVNAYTGDVEVSENTFAGKFTEGAIVVDFGTTGDVTIEGNDFSDVDGNSVYVYNYDAARIISDVVITKHK